MNDSHNRLKKITDLISTHRWYHSIELAPGVFTSGKNFGNIVLTRRILKNIAVESMNCIDIGAMDGLISVLLTRRGANPVTAHDRFDRFELSRRIGLVKDSLNLDFDFVTDKKIGELPGYLKEKGKFPSDIAVFSGVLYHMLDPFGGLASVRGMVRNGGIILIETAAVIDESMVLHFNAEGNLAASPTDYFMPSLVWLDYVLRFLRLKPVDCLHYRYGKSRKSRLDLCRVCIPCRALAAPLPEKNDDWMIFPQHPLGDRHQVEDLLSWNELESDLPPIGYTEINDRQVLREDTGSVDIYRTVLNSPDTTKDNSLIRLGLNDMA